MQFSMGSKLAGVPNSMCSWLWICMHFGQRGSRQLGSRQKLVILSCTWNAHFDSCLNEKVGESLRLSRVGRGLSRLLLADSICFNEDSPFNIDICKK